MKEHPAAGNENSAMMFSPKGIIRFAHDPMKEDPAAGNENSAP